MSIVRVQISGAGGWYTFPINPVSFENNDNTDINVSQTIDGYSFEMIPIFDGRPKTMYWENLPNKTPYSTLIANLKALKQQTSYLKLNDLSGSPGESAVQKIRVIDVETAWSPGAGPASATCNLKYSQVKLIYVHTT